MSSIVAVDFETFYSKRLKYTLTSQIAEQYCKHHLFDPYMISACDGSSAWSGHPKDFNWSALEGKMLLSHNAYFDHTVYDEMVIHNTAPKIAYGEWHCTANLTSYLCNRRSLSESVEHLFKVKLDKSARGEANNKHWPQDFSEAEQATLLKYAKDDALWCWKLWDKFSPQWPMHERRLSNLTIEQGRRGVQINVALLNDFIMWSHEMKMATEKLLPWLKDEGDYDEGDWEGFNSKPTSTKCIAEQCRRSGIPCPPVKATEGEEAFEAWENQYARQHQWIAALSAWRSINKSYKTFTLVKERLRSDNTLPFGLKYFGAHTGRWSGDARINFQNMRKVPIICNEHGLMETNERRCLSAMDCFESTGVWPEWVRHTIDFRHLIIPRAGKKMIVSDLSQIEPRVLAWLAGDSTLLNLLKNGMSIYEAHARTKMGWTGGKLKNENPEMYALAKANVLALGYQAGWEKYITMAYNLARVDITRNDPDWIDELNPLTGESERVSGFGFHAKRTVKEYRASNKLIVDLWKKLDEGFKRSVGEDYVMNLPSGRKMIYEKVRCETRIIKNKLSGLPQRQSVFTAGTGGKRVQYYGGKLAENATQATAREVFAVQMLAMEDNGWTNLFGVHDEAVLEVDKDITARAVEHAMSQTPDWLDGCPVGAEAHEVPHYLK
jgi:DNA polymerase I-like protein with 3'-5' exonuclease and polymerase domains